jgi:dienelactone hydrolase
MERTFFFACTLLVLFLSMIISGCGGGGNSPVITPPPIISVSISAASNSVIATGTDPLSATVTGDTSGKGVTWTVSCSSAQCGSVAANATANGSSTNFNATYTAPSAPPTSDLTVTVTATSVADSTRSASAMITVPAITISMNITGNITASTATTATVQVGTGNVVQMNASVNNDPSNQGVKFTISPTSQAGNLTVHDPFDAAYKPPASAPASDLTITVTATSIEDSTKSVTVTITVPSVTISINPTFVDNVEATSDVPNIVATIGNDPSNQGVRWTLSCSPGPCGTVSPAKTLSGLATTYTAPGTPPSPEDLLVTITATSFADLAAQASMTINVKKISVTVTPPKSFTGNVLFNTSLSNIVATVSFDPAKKGVTWSVQCDVPPCGSISPTPSASGADVTYTAPTSPPATDLFINVVASSESNPAQQGSTQITIPAITVSVSPPSAIIPVGATAALNATRFTPTINNDSSAQVNANWTLTQGGSPCSPAACGKISLFTTASGTATVYAAPSAVPSPANLTITATSATDASKSGSATITLVAGTVKLVPASLHFSLNKTQPQGLGTVTLTNAGNSTLSISSQTTTGSSAFSITGPCQGSPATNVTFGMSCSIGVTFKPPSGGSFNGTLVITDNDVSSPQQVALSGFKCTFRCRGESAFRSALANNRTPTVPIPTGFNKIGTRVIDLVDATRSDPYLANGSKRELLVRFWYPAAPAQHCEPAPYTSSDVWNYMAKLEKVPAPSVRTNSCQDAPVATGAHPVVVLTHGYTGTFTDYTFLAEDLASRGYIVASVNHTFEATAVQFPDGRLAKSVLGSHIGNTSRLDNQATSFAVAVRMNDLRFVMDQLERLNVSPTSAFAGRLELSRVAVMGHSLGGLTALLGMKMEPRFGAAVTLDGVSPGRLFGATEKPVLMLLTGRDSWDQDTCGLWNTLHGPRVLVTLKNADHLTPSDAVWLARGAVATGDLGMENTVRVMREHIAAFLDANLKGNSIDQLFEGKSSEYPDVEVSTQTPSACETRHVQR